MTHEVGSGTCRSVSGQSVGAAFSNCRINFVKFVQGFWGFGVPILPISDKLAPLPPKKFFGFFIFFVSFDLKFKINLFIVSF